MRDDQCLTARARVTGDVLPAVAYTGAAHLEAVQSAAPAKPGHVRHPLRFRLLSRTETVHDLPHSLSHHQRHSLLPYHGEQSRPNVQLRAGLLLGNAPDNQKWAPSSKNAIDIATNTAHGRREGLPQLHQVCYIPLSLRPRLRQ